MDVPTEGQRDNCGEEGTSVPSTDPPIGQEVIMDLPTEGQHDNCGEEGTSVPSTDPTIRQEGKANEVVVEGSGEVDKETEKIEVDDTEEEGDGEGVDGHEDIADRIKTAEAVIEDEVEDFPKTDAEEPHGGNISKNNDISKVVKEGEDEHIDKPSEAKVDSCEVEDMELMKHNGEGSESDTGQGQSDYPSEIMTRKRAASLTTNEGPRPKLIRNAPSSSDNSPEETLENDGEHDPYCWACHKMDVQIHCRICPRSYHTRCMQHDSPDTKAVDRGCVCPECVVVMKAENVNHRSDAMQLLSMDQLSSMLKYICGRMKGTPGAEPFLKPVSPDDAEDYYDYVTYPMDIAKLETNIVNRQYGSTEAFLADVQWIVHNSIIFNSVSSPYTAAAKRLLKVVRQELSEIETCPECYTNAHTKENWFIEACKRPHILVWAKLKGFPYWPAKAMKVKEDQVDVRFFGQHDRAWVNVKDCFLYSLEQPNAAPKKSSPLIAAIDELNQHIDKLKSAFGEVALAEGKVVMDATLGLEQIQRFLPKYVPQEPSQLRSSTQVNPKTVTLGKSPVVITISSLKTSPTVVSNSAVSDAPAESDSSESEGDTNPESGNPDDASSEEESSQPETKLQPVKPLKVKMDKDVKIKLEKVDAEAEKKEIKEKKDVNTDVTTVEIEPEERQRVPSGILASALGLRRVTKRPMSEDSKKTESEQPVAAVATRKSLRRLSTASADVKTDEEKSRDTALEELAEKEPIRIKAEFQQKKQSKAQDLMDQISSQAQTKPGYRFNISKDISISAIGTEGEAAATPQNNGTKLRRTVTGGVIETGGKLVRPTLGRVAAKPGVQSMQVQIQQMTQGAGGVKAGLNQGQGQRVAVVNKNTQGIRPIRANAARNNIGAQGTMVRPTVTVKTDPPVPVSTVTTTLQVTPSQSISGAITLPGGTITVTPLTPIIAGIPVSPAALPSYSTTTSTVNLNGAVNGLPALVPSKSGQIQQATAVVRRTGTVTLPHSVATHMQQCSKGINDLLKTTVEQIAFDILDGGSMSGKIDVAVAQKEKETLIVKHAKEISDLRHCHEIAMRELRVSLENEKRRQIIDVKRQCELEKNRAVEEAKKKQWCARCQREAQFYCCWNTSYCGYHCQEQHWPQHMNICNQNKAQAAAQEETASSTRDN